MKAVVILALAGVLALLWVMSLKDGVPDAECSRAVVDVGVLETCILRYKSMAGFLPSEKEGLEILSANPSGDKGPHDRLQLIKPHALIDPWGHPYQYRNPGKRHLDGYDVFSLGPDGKEGTEDDLYAQ